MPKAKQKEDFEDKAWKFKTNLVNSEQWNSPIKYIPTQLLEKNYL